MGNNTGKCSKPKGSYCRLHNPAPVSNFTSVQDVFQKIDENAKSRPLTNTASAFVEQEVSFQPISETRSLSEGVPLSLEEHIAKNRSEIEARNLAEHEKVALSGYTGFAAGVCNSVLLGREYEYYDEAPLWRETDGPCDFVNREDLIDYMETVDNVLSIRQEKRRIVYRGIPIYASLHDEIGAAIGKNLQINDTEGLVEGLKAYYKVGKTFNYATYLSTSQSAQVAAERTPEFGGTKQDYYQPAPEIKGIMFELKTNAGLDVTSIARRHTAYEREVVLPRDTHFKVVGVRIRPETYNTFSGHDETHHETFKQLAVVVQMVEVDAKGQEITHTKPHKPTPSIEAILPE